MTSDTYLPDRVPRRRPSEIDVLIGQRLRNRRQILGLTQEKLARRCNISPQQIQKYETGTSGIRASRLVQLADILEMPVEFFFEGLVSHSAIPEDQFALLTDPKFAELAGLFLDIPTDELKRALVTLVRAMAVTPNVKRVVAANDQS